MYYNNARRSMYHTLAVSHQLKFRHLRVLFCIRFSARRVAPKSLISYFCRWISSMEVFTWKYKKYMYRYLFIETMLMFTVCINLMHVLILKCNSDSLLIFFSLSFLTFTVIHVVLQNRKYCSLRVK